MLETEVKISCQENPLLGNYSGISFRLTTPRHFEDNWLFDFKDQRLRGNSSTLRLRTVNERGWLTFKGPPQSHPLLKIRPEFQVDLQEPDTMREILLALGLEPIFRYQKFRTVYQLRLSNGQQLEAMFDETPMGFFLELEGPENGVLQAAEHLSIPTTRFIQASYPTLWANFLRERDRPMQAMIFEVSELASQSSREP